MKFKTTRKAIVEQYGLNRIIKIGYCQIQTLLNPFSPQAYTCGVYGWNSDIYRISNYVICTGYRPFGGIEPDYQVCEKYENLAREIDGDYSTPWNERKELKIELLEQFIKEVTQ